MTGRRRRSRWCALLALAAGLAVAPSVAGAAQDEDPVADLPAEARTWLEQDVAYLITEEEREVFVSLQTAAERDAFIEVFWRKRDPIPATPNNEFREEHYRRLEYADRHFQEMRSRPGRETDRGRMYVILGTPRNVEHFDNYNELVSSELWFYEGDTTKGLPPFFYLLFYKPLDLGEYRLYSPVLDTPGALLRGNVGAQTARAFDTIYRISPELARASLSFDATAPVDRLDASAALLGTEGMLARIEESPRRAVRTDYIDGWLRYGKRVSAEYSFNFVPNRSTFAVLFGPGGSRFLHYALELDFENFPVETDEAKTRYYTTVDVSLEVRDAEGTLVLADEKESYIELSRSQIETGSGASFSYQDGIPLVPGDYSVSVALRNRVLHQFTVAERDVHVPPADESPSLSDLVLGFQVEQTSTEESGLKTFEVAGLRIQPAGGGLFALSDVAHLYAQVEGAEPTDRVRVALLDETGATVRQEEVPPSELVVRTMALAELAGGNYDIRVELVRPSSGAGGERVLDASTAPLQLSPRSSVPRPGFTVRRSFAAEEPGMLALALGDQLWSLGRFEEATRKFEAAVAAENPNLPMARWKLAGAYVRARESKRALELLEPLAETHPDQYEVVLGLGLAYYLEEKLPEAARHLERASELRPASTSLLNALGDVYRRLGRSDDARRILERSLELDPSQEVIRRQLAEISG